MNLFVLGHGLNRDQCARASASLKKTIEVYKQLEHGQYFDWQSECHSVFAACHYPNKECLGSRRYVAESEDVITIFDGLPIACDDRFAAHDSRELGQYWDEFAAELDGFFCAARIDKSANRLHLQLDSFGVYEVFYWTDGKAWLLSNSIALLDRFTGNYDLDPEGASRLLTMGWVAGNRTLRKGIRAFPAGERWTWSPERSEPLVTVTFDRKALASRPKANLSQLRMSNLVEELSQPLRVLGHNFTNIYCPLTGGKDSRVLAALLTSSDVMARYYTYGNREGSDSAIAAQVAEVLGVNHETLLTKTQALLADWNDVVRTFVLQGDGMCPLQLIMGAVSAQMVEARPIPVRVWGAGGELGRAFHFNPIQAVRGMTVKSVQDTIVDRWVNNAGGLMRPETCAAARKFVQDAIVGYADDGFRPDDLGDVFFLYERGGRRAGKNMRANMSLRDSYSPFFSRRFVEAAFSLDSVVRRTEPLHYGLLKELSEALVEMPFDKGAWTSRSASLNLYTELARAIRSRIKHKLARELPWMKTIEKRHILVSDTNFERTTWLQQIQGQLREMCLDDGGSEIWDYVNRGKFDKATAQSATSSNLSRNAKGLFLTATLYYYESQSRELRADRWTA